MSGLRDIAEKRNIQIGACASVHPLETDPDYARMLANEFNVFTPENALKFSPLSPERGVYNFKEADGLVDFAERNNMKIRGHVLVWFDQLPYWLSEGKYTRDELIEILIDHIWTVVNRYKGKIDTWDVVNEAIDNDGKLKGSIWSKIIGAEYLDIAFRTARIANPDAILFYNDLGIEGTEKHFQAVYKLLRNLREKDVPVDGAGLQMHLQIHHIENLESLPVKLQKLADLGLRVHLTELDVRMKINNEPDAGQLADQAYIYRKVINSYLGSKVCEAVIFWGFTDKYSWIPYYYPGEGNALLFDKEYRRKPCYQAIVDELLSK